ncbi:MAG: hypothetical protein WBD22_06235 [Pyrinomonadaceae bacterium]
MSRLKASEHIGGTVRLSSWIREIDVLEQWSMSRATLARARKKGLEFARHGAFVVYRPQDLEEFFCKPRNWGKADARQGEGDTDG